MKDTDIDKASVIIGGGAISVWLSYGQWNFHSNYPGDHGYKWSVLISNHNDPGDSI